MIIGKCIIVTCMTAPPGGGGVRVGVNLTLVYSFVLFKKSKGCETEGEADM